MPEGGKGAPPKDAGKAPEGRESGFRRIISRLRKRRIIETLAAFIGAGWLIIEFVHFILIGHYHLPEKTLDITFVTLIGTLLGTLAWRWSSGREKPRKFKPELLLIPLIVLITALLDLDLLLRLKTPEPEFAVTTKWKNSIAVLPFVDMSPQKDQEWFCDGITDEIIGQLSNISGLKVPARTSVFFFKGKNQDIRDIGKTLGVATVLEGSIQKVESRLRARVQLINIADGFHLWSEVFDRDMRDVFAIQDEIALAVADKLKISLLSGDKAKLVKRRTENLEAYELYLKALQFTAWTNESIENAISYLKRSLQLDPDYAPSHAALANKYINLVTWGLDAPGTTFSKARAEAMRAIELDASSTGAHLALGTVKWRFEWDFSGAEREFQRAMELNPNSSAVHDSYSDFLAIMGRLDEAVIEALKAHELDPVSFESERDLAWTLFLARRYDESIDRMKKAMGMDQNRPLELAILAGAYARNGMDQDAAACSSKARELVPAGSEQMLDAYLADPFCRTGKMSEALKWIEIWKLRSAQGPVEDVLMAIMIAPTGNRDLAFAWLETGIRERSVNMPFLKVHPHLDTLRSDPRFPDLLRRVGFPDR
jgi:adenylate cyclase